MQLNCSPRSSLLTLLVAAGAPLFGAGCSPQVEATDLAALRHAFPEQAAVLAQGEGFVATERGFARRAPAQAGAFRRVEAELPSGGEGSIRLRTRGGFEVQVREVGAEGAGRLVERAVTYPRAGGTAYWTATPGGVEEWLHLTGARGDVAAAWEVAGAALEQQGEHVAVVDAAGVARLWVSAPEAYAAGGRPVRVGLRTKGTRIELLLEDGGEEVLVDPVWLSEAPMMNARAEHSAALLPNGKVLVVGGAGSLQQAELYDAKTSMWNPASESLATGRAKPAAVRLGNGDLLVLGDAEKSSVTAKSVELYEWLKDEALKDSWSNKTGMNTARQDFRATLLSDGQRVLVAGGSDKTAELYDSKRDEWTYTKTTMTTERYAYSATLLGDGKVLVVGGEGMNEGALPSAELYTPGADTWSLTGMMTEARVRHTATLLPSGSVLVVGGSDGKAALASAALYDPGAGTWSQAGTMTEARVRHTATLLPSGSVLVVGGSDGNGDGALQTAEVYDPSTKTWSQAGTMEIARRDHTATLLANGSVLIAGGVDASGALLKSTELYTPIPLGDPCEASGECQSGYCVNLVCCNTACNADPCETCTAAQKGICGTSEGAPCDDRDPCTSDDKCTNDGSCEGVRSSPCKTVVEDSGGHSVAPDEADIKLCASSKDCEMETGQFCVDGVCCDAQCNGPCESCVVPNSIGKCKVQENTDLREECHVGYVCSETCGGKSNNGSCIAWEPGKTQCAPSECYDEIHGAGPVTCEAGPPSCPVGTKRVPFDCTPYRCVEAFGQCMPYCHSIDDCAPGFVCNMPKGDCVAPPDKAYGKDSGCALAAGGSAGDAARLGALVAGLAAAWRRRRARHGSRSLKRMD